MGGVFISTQENAAGRAEYFFKKKTFLKTFLFKIMLPFPSSPRPSPLAGEGENK